MAEYVTNLKLEEAAGAGAGTNSKPAGESANGSGNGVSLEDLCRQTTVTILADNWPQEIAWTIVDIETGNVIVSGNNDDFAPRRGRLQDVLPPVLGVLPVHDT